jgi:hypothetical protein
MDLNFLIERTLLLEKEEPKPEAAPDVIGIVKRINTEKHAKGQRLSDEHLKTVQHLIKTHKASGEDIDLFHKHVSAYPQAKPKQSLIKGWLDSHSEEGAVTEPEKPVLTKEDPSTAPATKKNPFGTFVDKDEHIALGGGVRLRATGRMKGGMIKLNMGVHLEDGTGLADPGGIFHSKAKFLNKPSADGTPGSPVRWFSDAIYKRFPEIRTMKLPLHSGPEHQAENEARMKYRDELSLRLNTALVSHKIAGKTLRQHSADLPDDETGHKTFEHHAGSLLDSVRKSFDKEVTGWRQQRGVMTKQRDEEGNFILDAQGEVIETPERKRAPEGKGIVGGPQGKLGVTAPVAGSKKYAKPEAELTLPPLEASDAPEPTPVKPPRTKSVDDLIAQTVERAKKSKIS